MRFKVFFSSIIIIFACIIFFTYNYIGKKKEKIVPINERIRDLIYIKSQNKIILFLESIASIGVINL